MNIQKSVPRPDSAKLCNFFPVTLMLGEHIEVGLMVDKMVGIIVETKASVEQGLGGYLLGGVIPGALPEHPVVMFQYPVNGLDGFTLFVL